MCPIWLPSLILSIFIIHTQQKDTLLFFYFVFTSVCKCLEDEGQVFKSPLTTSFLSSIILYNSTFSCKALKCICIDWLQGFSFLSFVPFCILSDYTLSVSDSLSFCLSIYCPTSASFFFQFLYSPPLSLLFASELKMDLNGWGHGELSTPWSYDCYWLC